MLAAALSCRSCASPLSDGATADCPACGAAASTDPAVLRRLERARGRMRRTRAQVHAFARHLYMNVVAMRWRALYTLLFLGALLGPPFALVAAIVVGEATGALDAPANGVAGMCAALGFVGFLAAIPLPPLALLWGLGTALGRRGRRHADGVAGRIAITVPGRCPSCGAHVDRIAVGEPEPEPCPWCGAALAVLPEARPEVDAVEDALIATWDAEGRGAWVRLLGPARQGRRPEAAGLSWDAGQWTGRVAGAKAWCAEDTLDAGILRQLEVAAPLAVDRPSWLLPPSPAFRRALAELGHEAGPPGERVGRHTWHGADVDADAVRALASTLGPREALLVEPAGVAVWRLSPNALVHMTELPKGWLCRRVPQVAAVVEALRA